MQISRHWRLNPVRYRMQGVRYENGVISLQNRPHPPVESAPTNNFLINPEGRSVVAPPLHEADGTLNMEIPVGAERRG